MRAGDVGCQEQLGEFVAVGSSASSGQKRQRAALKFTLNKARVLEVAGADAAKRVPTRYSLTLDAPAGTRILAQPPGGGFAFVGVATRAGTMVPEVTDPAYSAYMDARRKREVAASAARSAPRLAEGPSALGVLAAANRNGDGLGGFGAAILGGASGLLTDSSSAPSVSSRIVPRVATIYALFEAGSAYWSLRELAEATGKKEGDVKGEVGKACDYIRAGPHKGKYRLKPEWRSINSVAPDPEDGIGQNASSK